MGKQRLAGALWLIAGISSGAIAFFLVEPLDLAIFIGGAVLAILVGLAILVHPSLPWLTWSNLLGAAWLVVFGAVILTRLSLRSRSSSQSSGFSGSAWQQRSSRMRVGRVLRRRDATAARAHAGVGSVVALIRQQAPSQSVRGTPWFPTDPPARQGAKLPLDIPGMRLSVGAIAEA